MVLRLTLFLLVSFAPSLLALAADPPNVLDLQEIMQLQNIENQKGVVELRAGNHLRAQVIFRENVERVPHDMVAWYNLACSYALRNESASAIDSLKSAIKFGFRSSAHLEQDQDLQSLRELPEFKEVIEAAKQPPGKEPVGWSYSVQVAKRNGMTINVDSPNMLFNPQQQMVQVFVDVAGSGKDRLPSGLSGAVGDRLLEWTRQGTAAGNIGDLYDNHDRGHSTLDLKLFPQMTSIRYGAEVQKRQLDNGAQRMFLFMGINPTDGTTKKKDTNDKDNTAQQPTATEQTAPPAAGQKQMSAGRVVVLGNSSTALTGSSFWRSMPRFMLTSPHGIDTLVNHYTNNHIYVYPEHRDHDPGHDDASGWGDLFHANTPYYIVTQGSSLTDQPVVQALAATLGAFSPKTKERLVTSGLIAPTLQMIFRYCNQGIQSDEAYLSPAAHPTVFEGTHAQMEPMVQMAHKMQPDEVPPVCVIRVVKETAADPSKDYFDSQPNEALLNSPFAISRLGVSSAFWREIDIEAQGSDINGRPITYVWKVLRGDPELTQILPIENQENTRRIKVGFQTRRRISKQSDIESSRVDIGVFAFNGVYYSAPSIFSYYFADDAIRTYDDQKRIQSIDYEAAKNNYADPAIVPRRDWRDQYHYSSDGTLTGWTRTRTGKPAEEFDASGKLLTKDSSGKQFAVKVLYRRETDKEGRPSIRYGTQDER